MANIQCAAQCATRLQVFGFVDDRIATARVCECVKIRNHRIHFALRVEDNKQALKEQLCCKFEIMFSDSVPVEEDKSSEGEVEETEPAAGIAIFSGVLWNTTVYRLACTQILTDL